MLTAAILLINFASLAGIVAGFLLRSNLVREAIAAAYVHSSDIAKGQVSQATTQQLAWSFISTSLLDANGSLSLKKLVALSFLSSIVFSVTLFPTLGEGIAPASPIARFFGGGTFGVVLGNVAVYLMAWPGHYVYDYLVCRVLLVTTRSGSRRSLRRQLAYTALSLIAVSLVPLLTLALYSLLRFHLPGYSYRPLPLDAILLGVPFIWNAPTFFWIGILSRALNWGEWWSSFVEAPQVAMFALSAMISAAPAFFDLFARILVKSRTAMRVLSESLLAVSSADADKIFTHSLAAFAVGNGLCQIFGVSIKL